MPTEPARHPTSDPAPRSRFTWVLYGVALVLGVVALGVRIVDGVRTGRPDWLSMAAPAGLLVGFTAIIVGQRRPAFYYPALVVAFALLVASYAIPRHRRLTSAGDEQAAPPVRP